LRRPKLSAIKVQRLEEEEEGIVAVRNVSTSVQLLADVCNC